MFLLFRIGTHKHDAIVGIVSARSPHLLAVDDPVIAVLDGARLEAGDIGACAGFGEQLAPYLLATQRGADITLHALGLVECDHRGDAHAKSDGEWRNRRLELLFLLSEDDRVDRR